MGDTVNFDLSQPAIDSGDPNIAPGGIIQYLDLQSLPDNSCVVHEETTRQFQILIIDESDKITDEQLSQINLDKIEAEHEMQDEQLEKQLSQVDFRVHCPWIATWRQPTLHSGSCSWWTNAHQCD